MPAACDPLVEYRRMRIREIARADVQRAAVSRDAFDVGPDGGEGHHTFILARRSRARIWCLPRTVAQGMWAPDPRGASRRKDKFYTTRSMIGPINPSGTRIVPSVSTSFAVPWSSDPPVTNLPRKRARLR